MDNKRKEKLLETMKRFNKDNKEEILSFADEKEDAGVVATGIEKIDNFIGQGTKKSTFTIIWGAYSSGKTSLVLTQIANAQKQGQICCYINLEKPIDKERFEFFGVNLKELVLCEFPNNAEKALEVVRTLCKEKVVDLIVIDSIQGMAPKDTKEDKGGKDRALEKNEIAMLARTMSKFFPVVGADVFNAKASVVFIGQVRTGGIGSFFTHAELTGGEAQKFYAYQILFMRKGQKSNNPQKKFKEYWVDPDGKLHFETKTEDVGFSVVMRMDKTNSSKSAKEHAEIEIPFYYDSGFNVTEINDEPEIRIDQTMPEDEQEKVRQILIEKGILPEIFSDAIKNLDDVTFVKKPQKQAKEDEIIEKVSISGGAIVPIKEGEVTVTEPPKKRRGRPSKKEKK